MTSARPDYMTVKEAAAELGVHPSTIWRWIDAGRLPAQRIGPKIIRLRKSDVSGSGAMPSAKRGSADRHGRGSALHSLRRRTPEQQRALTQAVGRADDLRARILARRGGKPVPSSTDVIRQERENRSRQT